ncbi:hypothetical protein N2152v2_003135 [Parachlorella kessleri]
MELRAAVVGDRGGNLHCVGIPPFRPLFVIGIHFVRVQMYMLPDGRGPGALRLYRATSFPLRWELATMLLDRPLAHPAMGEWEGRWWLLGSPAKRRNEVEAYYADSPLGPWTPHALNPIALGRPDGHMRLDGRMLHHDGALLQYGRVCSRPHGCKFVGYRIDKLTPIDLEQSVVPVDLGPQRHDPSAWNGMQQRHLDAAQLPDGSWVAVMDGSYRHGGIVSSVRRHAAVLLGALLACISALACKAWLAHLRRCGGSGDAGVDSRLQLPLMRETGGSPTAKGGWGDKPWQAPLQGLVQSAASKAARVVAAASSFSEKAEKGDSPSGGGKEPRGTPARKSSLGSLRSASPSPLSRIKSNSAAALSTGSQGVLSWWHAVCLRLGLEPGSRAACWAGWAAGLLGAAVVLGLATAGVGAWYFLSIYWDGGTAGHAVAVGGQLSKFTLLTMTYSARLPTLQLFVEHYSKCPSVAEILVVWNSGPPPDVARDFPGTPVPVRVRVEAANSLNNRFRPDPLLTTRGVLQLDDDTLIRCSDVELGFTAWRLHPHALVGYYPRLIETEPAAYLGEATVFRENTYNAVITKAAFLDAQTAFQLYWSPENAPGKCQSPRSAGRAYVDRLFNGEDILMNFVLAAHARANQTAALGAAAVEAAAAARRTKQLIGRGPGGFPYGQPQEQDAPGGGQQEQTVLYVHPRRRLDISGLSSVGISRSSAHAEKRRLCVAEFTRLFQGNPLQPAHVNQHQRPLCNVPFLGCVHL